LEGQLFFSEKVCAREREKSKKRRKRVGSARHTCNENRSVVKWSPTKKGTESRISETCLPGGGENILSPKSCLGEKTVNHLEKRGS